MNASRREFLAQSTLVAASALLPSHQSYAKAHAVDVIPGPDTVMKFGPDGTVRPFAGNTVICHLPAQCVMRDVMAEFREAMRVSTFCGRLGLTTVESYHMTIFPGANDQGRKASGWPSYVPPDATIEQCDNAVLERMRNLRLHCELPFRVMVDVPATLAYPRACTLRMKAVDDREETKLRSVRDQLATAYGFRLPGHATYGFHVTMSYQVAPFTAEESRQFNSMRSDYVNRLVAAQPVLELGNPEFCTFRDMFRFEPRILLANA